VDGFFSDLSLMGMQAVLKGADLQKGVTGKTIDGRWTGKEPETAGEPELAAR
jgi:hypothetical protein